jgi:putative PIN family toxin of toxin-antitoxin system
MTVLYVVDTNVIVSALLTASPESPTVCLLERMLTGRMRFLVSTDLLAEYREVLLRPRLARKHGLTAAELDVLLAELVANGTHRDPDKTSGAPDPKDNHLLALLQAEPRAVLITGDDVLARSCRKHYAVLSPREWLDR